MNIKDPQLKEALELIKQAIFDPLRDVFAITGVTLFGGQLLQIYNHPEIAYAWTCLGAYCLALYAAWVTINYLIRTVAPIIKKRMKNTETGEAEVADWKS